MIHVYDAYDAAQVVDEERQFNRHVFPIWLEETGEVTSKDGTRRPDDNRPHTWMLVPWEKVAGNLGFDPRTERGPSWVR